MSEESVMIPCPECGSEVVDGEDVTYDETVPSGFTFQGEEATYDTPAKICPDCGNKVKL